MKNIRKGIANCFTSFQKNYSFFLNPLLENPLGGHSALGLVPVPVKPLSPQKPAAVYRSNP